MVEKQSIKGFDIGDIEVAINAVEKPDPQHMNELFKEAVLKINIDLLQGFTVWLKEGDLGTTVVYNSNGEDRSFMTKRNIFNGVEKGTDISGTYKLGNNVLTISASVEEGIDIINSRVFINGKLVSSNTNPFSTIQQNVTAFHRNIVVDNEGDAERLDDTISPERSPIALVIKMLRDFMESNPNVDKTKEMFKTMDSIKSNFVIMNDRNPTAENFFKKAKLAE